MLADAIVRWTARLFVACYLGRICIDAARCRDARSQKLARGIWTVGCFACLAHVVAAFHFVHHWSHSAAYEHVLHRTLETTGFATGIGLSINHAFVLIWIADVFFWWRSLAWSDRPVPYWIVQILFGFLIFQATAVFGPAFWIPIVVMAILILVALWMCRRHSTSPGL
jgi:hypothetical protein